MKIVYNQANELVEKNQHLEIQLKNSKQSNSELSTTCSDLKMRCEILSDENVDLNRQSISNQIQIEQLNTELNLKQNDLNKFNELKRINSNLNQVNELNRRLELELKDKNDLIEQLNHAKDFLETTNSQLLLKNVKMQLFLEDMGLSVEQGKQSFDKQVKLLKRITQYICL